MSLSYQSTCDTQGAEHAKVYLLISIFSVGFVATIVDSISDLGASLPKSSHSPTNLSLELKRRPLLTAAKGVGEA
jgi:hypothetical protein